jgi:site-specific recombinase XerD
MTAELALSPSPVDDLSPLDQALRGTFEKLVKDGTAKNTVRTYTNLYKRFDLWSAKQGLQSNPVTAAALAGYLAHLSNERVQPSTLRHFVSVITSREKAAGRGMSEPVLKAAELAVKGHVENRNYEDPQKAYPLVPDDIREVVRELDLSTFTGQRAALILTLGYSGAMRVSEQAALRIGDVPFTPTGVNLRFWKSKTDQSGRGEVRPIPTGRFALTDPVTRLREYLEALASFGIDVSDPTLPLLRSVNKKGEPRQLLVKNGRTYGGVTGDSVGLIIRNACRTAQLVQWESVSGHSLRAGFATACAFQQDPVIPMASWGDHGRWARGSMTPWEYVRDAERVQGSPLNFAGV